MSGQQRIFTVILSAGLTFAFLVRMASGIGIYTSGSGLVGLIQSCLVRRRIKQLAA